MYTTVYMLLTVTDNVYVAVTDNVYVAVTDNVYVAVQPQSGKIIL